MKEMTGRFNLIKKVIKKKYDPDILLNQFEHHESKGLIQSNWLMLIAMMYMMFPMMTGLLLYKMISFNIPFTNITLTAPLTNIIAPISFCLCNIVAEVYGYRVARNMTWGFQISSFTFVMVSAGMANFPTNANIDHLDSIAYTHLFGFMPVIFLAGFLASLTGETIDAYIVSKLKTKMKGKDYWKRSFQATVTGEFFYILIAYPIIFFTKVDWSHLLLIMASSFLIKFTVIIPYLFVECIAVDFLKTSEGVDHYDIGTNYNPFQFSVRKCKESPLLKVVNKVKE
ncbi:queuosine precursor transporter [Piscirickettsia salmonis]|uniref:queuosine precursor transporter n=1 Tax=Piscirickettsia salmonis TaxID=1238 RepID=UPI00048763AF|nr:queuosine precursor transporter [Piscirickettsia salmonis]QGO01483.1 hypothetical protein Psal008_00856 [Piscirickettsia salmonis]